MSQGGVTIKSFGYDTAGRTTSVVTGAGTTTLSYDFEGRISGITYPNSSTNSFSYNGLDTRVSKTDSSGTTAYKRDGVGVTDPVINDGTANYTPGISERRSSATKFVHADKHGSTTALGESSQTVSDTRQFDGFGMLVGSTGSTATPFGFAGAHGYQSDADSGLILLGHRYYDSSTGRFLIRDPIRDGRNWYSYCRNNPTKYADPTGLIPPLILGALAVVALAGGAVLYVIGSMREKEQPQEGFTSGKIGDAMMEFGHDLTETGRVGTVMEVGKLGVESAIATGEGIKVVGPKRFRLEDQIAELDTVADAGPTNSDPFLASDKIYWARHQAKKK